MFEFIILFDRHQDVLFYHENQITNKALLAGLISECRRNLSRQEDTEEMLHNLEERDILLQSFSPLVASYTSMHENQGMEYQAIEVEQSKSYLLMQTADNCLIVGFYRGDHPVNVAYAQLGKVAWIFRHLYGPCWDQLNKLESTIRSTHHQLIHGLLRHMWRMQQWEFNMNFQAVERVHISANIKIQATQALVKVQKRCQKTNSRMNKVDHMLLFVGTKLFCQVTGDSPVCVLNSDTLLFLVTLASVLYYSNENESVFACNSEGTTSDGSPFPGFTEDEEIMQLLSPTAAALSSQQQRPITRSSSFQQMSTTTGGGGGGFGASGTPITSGGLENVTLPKRKSSISSYRCLRLLLSSTFNVYMPFNVHMKRLAEDVVFVCIEQVSLCNIAVTLISHIQFLQNKLWMGGASQPLDMRALTAKLQQGFNNNSALTVASGGGGGSFQVSSSSSFSFATTAASNNNEISQRSQQNVRASLRNLEMLANRWDEKGRRLIVNPKNLIESESTQYFNIVSNILLNLCNLFCDQFLISDMLAGPNSSQQQQPSSSSFNNANNNNNSATLNVSSSSSGLPSSSDLVRHSSRLLKQQLGDYFTFLSVKAKRNLPITKYYSNFPGLVHFVCVSSEELLAPEFDLDFLSGQQQENIQRQMIWCHHLAQQTGATSICLLTKGFRYSYFVVSLPDPQAQRPQRSFFSQPNTIRPVGMLKFILLIVHLSCVPESLVTLHADKLINEIDQSVEDFFRSF